MRISIAAIAACGTALLPTALAVFADEAWNVDYHYPLLGEPKPDTTFFHQPNPASRASLLYTLSSRGVLGAVNPKDGAIVWRQFLQPATIPLDSQPSFLRASEGQDIVVSGIGHKAAAWSAADGRQAWELAFRGHVVDVEILEMVAAPDANTAKDVIVMSSGDGQAVVRVDGASGEVKWEFKMDTTDIPYQVSTSTTEVFAIALHKTMLGNIKIKVITLDPVTGRKTDEYSLSSDSELASSGNILSVGANSASPIIAWTDFAHSVLKVNLIGTKTVATFPIEKDGEKVVESIKVHAPIHANALAHFLVHYETAASHWADVFHIDLKRNKIEKSYTLPAVPGRGAFSTSCSDANVYFTRVTHNSVMTISSAQNSVLATWPIKAITETAAGDELVQPMHITTETSVRGKSVSAVRTAVMASTGDWALLRDGVLQWERPEQLAGTVSAAFAQSAVTAELAQSLEIEADSNPLAAYVHRVKRHLADLQQLPITLATLPQKLVHGFIGTTAERGDGSDVFGFHQVVACATDNGRLVALDSGSPYKIIWNKQLAPLELDGQRLPIVRSTKPGTFAVTYDIPTIAFQFNSSTGEQLLEIAQFTSEDAAASHAIQYTVQNGLIEANVGSSPRWQFAPPAGEQIVSVNPRPVDDPVASIGKVLGDRRVLYKFLSQNTALVVAANEAANSATFYVLDTVSGAVLHASTHKDVDLTAPLPAVMSENWFAYAYTSAPSDSAPKGSQLVAGEMFESLVPNDRGPYGSAVNVSSMHGSSAPFVLTQTYQVPEAISKLAVTRTRQGITSRQLLAVLPDSRSIVGIPYGAIDPRRPIGRDPTKDEMMEGLSRYAPVIEFDPQWCLNHQREVLGIREVIASPANIESTSLIFAYGLDIFGTRMTPSFSFDILGKDFNKLQMLATVAALAAATIMVAPLVMRKQINARWQFA